MGLEKGSFSLKGGRYTGAVALRGDGRERECDSWGEGDI